MSKTFISNIFSRMMLAIVVLMAGWSQNVAAEGSGTMDDPFVMVDGGQYQETSSKYFYAKFVVPADVTEDDVYFVIDNLRSMLFYVYTDAAYSQEVGEESLSFAGSNPWTMKLAVQKGTAAGTTFYFKTFSMQNNTLSVEYGVGAGKAKPANLDEIIPADGSVLSASLCNVTFVFTQDVVFDGAELQAGGLTKYPAANGQGRYVSIEPKAELAELYQSETLKEGDDIVLTLKNVRAVNGANVVGDVKVTYKAAAKPVMVKQTVNTPGNGLDTFLSFMPSSFENGMVQVVFDGDLLTDNPALSATLSYGSIETEGDFYMESLPVKFFGTNTIAVDLRGKLRTVQTMGIASGTLYDTMSLSFRNLKDASGNFVFSAQSGAVGSFVFDYKYKVVEYSYDKEFTPAPGSNIDKVKSIELYLRESGDGKMTYDGARFQYTDGGTAKTLDVAASMFDVRPDSEDDNALLVNIPVPEFSRDANTDVVLALTGVETPDGVDHSADFRVKYTTAGHAAQVFTVASATMTTADGTTVVDLLAQPCIEKLIADATLTIATNMDSEIGLMKYKVVDATTGDVVKSFYDTDQKNADGHWDFWIAIDYPLYAGHDYEIVLEGWSTPEACYADQPSLGSTSIKLQGATVAYAYSDVTLVSPAELLYDAGQPNFVLQDASDNQLTFTFSAPVTVAQAFVPLGFGVTSECSVTMSADGCTANVRVPETVITSYSQFVVSLLVKDSQGRVVKGNNGEGEASYISVYVDAKFNLPVPELTSPAEGSSVSELHTLRFHYAQGIQPTWSGARITVISKGRDVVATSTEVINVIPEEEKDNFDYIVTDVDVVLDAPVTTDGYYTIVVPEGFFNLDLESQGFSMKSNRECSFNVEVKGAGEPVVDELDCTVSPAEGKVECLQEFNITFNDYYVTAWTQDVYPVFTDASGNNTEVTNLQWGDDWTLANQLKCVLAEPVTADGIYKLTIPAGAVTYNDNPQNVNNVAVVFEYTIGTGNAIAELLRSTASSFDVYTPSGLLLRRQVSAEALKALPSGTYVINGRKVIVR